MTTTTSAIQTLLSTSTLTTPAPTFTFTPYLRTHSLSATTTTVPLCPVYASTGTCPLDKKCPNRHPTPAANKTTSYLHPNNYVCKHWLKGLCKLADSCHYLHEYNLRKMSECQFYNQNGYCQNGDECLYVHVKEESRVPVCEEYEGGFCEKGPRCNKRHVRRKVCEFYLAGFCPEGRECKFGVHLRGKARVEEEEKPGKKDKERVADLERREDEVRREGGWREKKGRGGGGRGRWRDKRR
jgi:cleavage and polyadenylation specificity factor subunit 4